MLDIHTRKRFCVFFVCSSLSLYKYMYCYVKIMFNNTNIYNRELVLFCQLLKTILRLNFFFYYSAFLSLFLVHTLIFSLISSIQWHYYAYFNLNK